MSLMSTFICNLFSCVIIHRSVLLAQPSGSYSGMGVLISCCLRLIGYDHLEGDNSSSRRKQNINSLLSDRDNPHVDGRR